MKSKESNIIIFFRSSIDYYIQKIITTLILIQRKVDKNPKFTWLKPIKQMIDNLVHINQLDDFTNISLAYLSYYEDHRLAKNVKEIIDMCEKEIKVIE